MSSLLELNALEILTKVTLLLAAVLAIRLLLFRSSAATRHLLQVAGLSAALLIPAVMIGFPALELGWLPHTDDSESFVHTVDRGALENWKPAPAAHKPAIPQPTLTATPSPSPSPSPSASPSSSPMRAATSDDCDYVAAVPIGDMAAGAAARLSGWAPGIWLMGALTMLGVLAFGWARMARLALDATPVEDARVRSILDQAGQKLGLRKTPRALISDEVKIPVLWGFVRPTLIVPRDATQWSDDALRVVALHELSHVRRGDGLSLLIGRLATAAYWFHPLAWWIQRESRRDCERACDDHVLACGERASSYAAQLVDFAKRLPRPMPAHGGALAIMRPKQLDGRVRAILNPGLRRGLGRKAAVALVAVMAVALVAVASPKLVAQEHQPEDRWQGVDEFAEPKGPPVLLAQNRVPHEHRHDHGDDHDHDGDAHRYSSPGDEAFSRAYELHKKEKFEQAIELFEQAVELDYRPATSMYNIACGHARLGRAGQALDWLDRAMESGLDAVDYVFEDTDFDPIRADPGFQRLLDRLRDSPEGRERAGELRDRREETIRRYEALMAGGSTDGKLWAGVGTDLLLLRELDLATDALNMAIENLPYDNDTELYNLACAHALSGRADFALDALERAVFNGFSNQERFANDTDLASIRGTERFAQLVALSERLSLARFNEQIWAKRHEQHKKTHKHHGRHGHDGQDGHDCDDCDDWRYDPEVWSGAIDHFTQVTRDYPRTGIGYFNLGWALHYSRRHDEAVEPFAKAAELGYRTPTATYNVACAHAMAGNPSAALDWLERAAEPGVINAEQFENDSDLDSLRGEPRFERIVVRARVNDHDKRQDKKNWWKRFMDGAHDAVDRIHDAVGR